MRAGCLSTDTLSQTCITWKALKASLRSRVSVDKKEKKKEKGNKKGNQTTQIQHKNSTERKRGWEGRYRKEKKKQNTGIHEWGKFKVGF